MPVVTFFTGEAVDQARKPAEGDIILKIKIIQLVNKLFHVEQFNVEFFLNVA